MKARWSSISFRWSRRNALASSGLAPASASATAVGSTPAPLPSVPELTLSDSSDTPAPTARFVRIQTYRCDGGNMGTNPFARTGREAAFEPEFRDKGGCEYITVGQCTAQRLRNNRASLDASDRLAFI